MPRYHIVDDRAVNNEKRALGRLSHGVASLWLAITVRLSWIEEKEFGELWVEEPINGFYNSRHESIFVCNDLSPFQTASTIVHEARHAWQKQKLLKPLRAEWGERDARLYVHEFWGGLENRRGSVAEIMDILLRMSDSSSVTATTNRSYPHYPLPPGVRTRVIPPSDQELQESVLRWILSD